MLSFMAQGQSLCHLGLPCKDGGEREGFVVLHKGYESLGRWNISAGLKELRQICR